MGKTMQRKLLEHLSNVIEIDYCDLLKYFKEYYPQTQTEDYLDAVRTTLYDLLRNNYIKIKDSDIPITNIGQITNYDKQDIIFTLDHATKPEIWGDRLKGKITNEGRKFLAEIVRNEKQDEINGRLKRNSNIQVGTAIAVGVFTVFNVIIAGITFYQNSTKQTAQEKQVQAFQDSLSQLKNTELLNQKKYLIFEKAVKDSLKMK